MNQSSNPKEIASHRCQFEHIAFESDSGFRCDGTNQCWMTETSHYEGKHLCVFHMPKAKINATIAKLQSSTLLSLIHQWNGGEGDDDFLLPAMQCGYVQFDDIRFKAGVKFVEATFSGFASFKKVIFDCKVDFSAATFEKGAMFVDAKFTDYVSFNNAIFNSMVFFDRAIFSGGDVEFTATTFNQFTSFSSVAFSGTLIFQKSIFGDQAGFSEATFGDLTDFDKVEFQFGPDMRKCIFNAPPSFHDAKFSQSVDFRAAKFLDTVSRDSPPNYRTLKVAMNRVSNKVQEAVFYGLEQKSLRQQDDTSRSFKFFSKWYERCSNYGQSLVRPLLWLIAINLLSVIAYSSIKFPLSKILTFFEMGAPDFWGKLAQMIGFAVFNITSPFKVWTGDYIENVFGAGLSDFCLVAISLLASLQTILSLSLITLFLLALRRAFKLD